MLFQKRRPDQEELPQEPPESPEDETEEDDDGSYMALVISFGTLGGVLVSQLFKIDLAIAIPMGMLIGMLIGMIIPENKDDE